MIEITMRPGNEQAAVEFRFQAPPGHTVSVAGVFNDWDASADTMEYDPDESAYRCTLDLAPGEYEYKFVVDGKWMLDDGNPNFVSNDFGTLNSILSVSHSTPGAF